MAREKQDPKKPKKKGGFPVPEVRKAKPEAEPKPEDLERAEAGAEDPDLQAPAPEMEAAEGEDVSSGIKKEDENKSNPDDDLDEEINANYTIAAEAERDWIEEAKEDIEFKAGNQWDPEDRAVLETQRRPCLTFNKIKAIVKLLTGHFIQNSARIQVAPEGGEDQQFSDTADRVLDHVDEHAQLDFNLGYLFNGGQTCGRGFIELYLDYERDPIFGHLRSIYHGKPGVILMDPRGSSYDLNQDREFSFKLIQRSKAKLKELYPDKADRIEEISTDSERPDVLGGKEGDANNYGQAAGRSRVGINRTPGAPLETESGALFWVKEYWRFKYVKKSFVYFIDTGDTKDFNTPDEAAAEIEKRKAAYLAGGNLEAKWAVIEKERMIREMHVAVRCGGVILTDGLSPFEPEYHGFPFFQYIADWTPEAAELKDSIQGIVRCLKDPQREKNKARSQMLHIINTSASAGWIIDADSMDDPKKEDLKSFGSSPGIIIEKKSGSTVQRIDPTAAPVAQIVREKAADDSFKEVSGVNADLLAVDENSNPSGKAIALRIRQAITILEPDFRNFRYTKKLVGTAIVQMFPTMFDVPKLKKILGPMFMKSNGIDETTLTRFLLQIEDLRYNVKIAEQGDTKTMREETFEDLMQMLEKGIGLPFEILAEFMTLPNKAEFIKKVQEYQAAQAQNAQALAAAGGQAPAPAGAPRR